MKNLPSRFLLFAALLLASTLQAQFADTSSANDQVVGHVAYDGLHLFDVYGANGEFSAEERAMIITSRLGQMTADAALVPDSFRVYTSDSSYFVRYAAQVIFEIKEADAEALGMDRPAAADYYVQTIQQTLESRSTIKWIKGLAINVALVLLVLLLLFFSVKYLNKLFSRLNARIIRSNSKYISGVKLRNYEFLSRDRMLHVLIALLKAVKWLIIVLIIYLALPILFSFFPRTEGIAKSLFALVLDPVRHMLSGLVNYLPNVVTIIVIAVAVHYAVRFLRFLAQEIQDGKLQLPSFYPDWAFPTYQILRFIVYAFGFVMVFPYLPGSNSPIFQGVSVFLGLLVSFGSSSAISNAVAGIVITYMRPFKVGDRVKISDTTGDVIEKTLLVTRLRTIKNEDITIPNSSILTGHTVNYSSQAQETGLILHTTVTIGYDVSWQLVHQLLITAAEQSDMVEQQPKPFVLQTSLDDFYVSYQLNCYTKRPDKAAVIYSHIHQHIQDGFAEAKVEIMSPHYRANRDGSDITIPKSS